MNSEQPLQIAGLSVAFNQRTVLDDINLILEPGSVTGLLGRNGVGKTTLMKAALGLLPADSGSVSIFGGSVDQDMRRLRPMIGYVPQNTDGLDHLTAQQSLDIVVGFHPHWDHELVHDLAAQWQLDLARPLGQFSAGQRQLHSLLIGIGHQPSLLILDEPMAGLDPTARRQVVQTLMTLNADRQQTILLSSHIVSDLERAISHVAILHEGRILHSGELDEFKTQVRCLNVSGKRLPDQLDHPDILMYKRCSSGAQLWVRGWSDAKIKEFAQQCDLVVQAVPQSLEDQFIGLTS